MTETRRVPKALVLVPILLLVLAAAVGLARAQPGTIEKITFYGLYRMTPEAAKHALGVREGDPYDPALLRRRFQELWKLGVFEDIVIEAEDTPDGGKHVVVKVKERPVLASVTYEDNKVLNRTQIEDRLKERNVSLGLGKPLDMKAIASAEAAIRDYLGEKGHLDSYVKAKITEVTATTRAVNFEIRPGGKTRIRSIKFVGNEVFSDRKLRGALKLTEERHWWWPWSSKNLYHPLKWDTDVANIRDLYQNAGYLDVEVRPPVLDMKEKRKEPKSGAKEPAEVGEEAPAPTPPEGLTPKQLERWRRKEADRREKERKRAEKRRAKAQPKVKRSVDLTVQIVEGPQYRTGKVTIGGNKVFSEEHLRPLVPLREGAVLRNDALDAGVEAITRVYEDRGHLYATVNRKLDRHEGEPVADVEITVDEDKPYYVSTIEFSGNTSTQDRVLRREVLLAEGELFNRTKLDVSKIKINQLGYFEVKDDPVIAPVEGENRVKVTFTGEERGRNEIQVGGGYSGLDGAFFTGVYSTRNFLGRGQILSASVQVGGTANRYQLTFQEPWFLSRPYTLGVSLFRTDVDYGSTLKSSSKGFGILIGKRIGPFSAVRIGYNYQSVNSTALSLSSTGTIDNPVFVNRTATNKISSLTPVYSFDTINNPYRPTRGSQLSMSLQIAGGPLGGDTAYLKPIAQLTSYRRAFGRFRLAFHAETGLVRQWQGGTVNNTSTINGVPRFDRFWLGGDTQGPRVFDTRTITPLRYVQIDSTGRIVDILGDPRFHPVSDFVTSGGVPVLLEVGGNRFYLAQSELVYGFNDQVDLAFFVDVGDSLFEDQSWGFDTARVSAGLELRFYLPVFPVPLRLIYGWPIRQLPQDRTSAFTFSIGRSF